jgi:hypothetical protein
MVDATREMILDCNDIDLVKVTVPMWKDKDGNCLDVYIKQFSVNDGQEYLNSIGEDGKVPDSMQLKGIIGSVCDCNGNRLFTKKDIEHLKHKNLQVLTWLAEEIARINFSAIKPIEELAKN